MYPAIVILGLFFAGKYFPQTDKYAVSRNNMVTTQLAARGISDKLVLEAFRKVPRHLFVPPEYEKDAYGDFPLPIGHGQTISQPYVVAYMTESVKPSGSKRALEIGTGSGYQAAILSELTDTVYTIEIVPELARESATRLRILGYGNVVCRAGDGYAGWPGHAPFDIIIVTAAAESIPEPLVSQLAENGRMIIPVGYRNGVQQLKLVVKKKGKVHITDLLPVRFVPFTRKPSGN